MRSGASSISDEDSRELHRPGFLARHPIRSSNCVELESPTYEDNFAVLISLAIVSKSPGCQESRSKLKEVEERIKRGSSRDDAIVHRLIPLIVVQLVVPDGDAAATFAV